MPFKGAANIPVGSQLDTSKGRVALTSAADTGGAKTQTSDFYQGIFQVKQTRAQEEAQEADGADHRPGDEGSDRALAVRAAEGRARPRRPTPRRRRRGPSRSSASCGAAARASSAPSGKYSSATVRGTIWLVEDRCDGTLTKVTRGTVQVRDLRRKKTVTVKAGPQLPRARPAGGQQEQAALNRSCVASGRSFGIACARGGASPHAPGTPGRPLAGAGRRVRDVERARRGAGARGHHGTILGSPLTIYANDNGQLQVAFAGAASGEFYNGTAAPGKGGLSVAISTGNAYAIYGIRGGNNFTPVTPPSVSGHWERGQPMDPAHDLRGHGGDRRTAAHRRRARRLHQWDHAGRRAVHHHPRSGTTGRAAVRDGRHSAGRRLCGLGLRHGRGTHAPRRRPGPLATGSGVRAASSRSIRGHTSRRRTPPRSTTRSATRLSLPRA